MSQKIEQSGCPWVDPEGFLRNSGKGASQGRFVRPSGLKKKLVREPPDQFFGSGRVAYYLYSKICLEGPLKNRQNKGIKDKINGSFMKVESIAECSLGNTFDLH